MTTTALTLGDQLKANRQRIENEAREKELREKAAEQAKAKAALDAVTEFFTSARAQFTERILSGQDAGVVKLGDGSFNKASAALETFLWRGPTDGIVNPNNKYHFLWLEFSAWADANGLKPSLTYEDDGFGKAYWYVLKVVPLN